MQYQIDQEARIPFLPGNSFSDIQVKNPSENLSLNNYIRKKTLKKSIH